MPRVVEFAPRFQPPNRAIGPYDPALSFEQPVVLSCLRKGFREFFPVIGMNVSYQFVGINGAYLRRDAKDSLQVAEQHTSTALEIQLPNRRGASLHCQVQAIIRRSKIRRQFSFRHILPYVGGTRQAYDHGYCEDHSNRTQSITFIPLEKLPDHRDRERNDRKHRPYRWFRALAV